MFEQGSFTVYRRWHSQHICHTVSSHSTGITSFKCNICFTQFPLYFSGDSNITLWAVHRTMHFFSAVMPCHQSIRRICHAFELLIMLTALQLDTWSSTVIMVMKEWKRCSSGNCSILCVLYQADLSGRSYTLSIVWITPWCKSQL
jgi:hypothetical protein